VHKRIDRGFPVSLRHLRGDPVIRDNAGIALGKRDKDEDATPIFGVRNTATDGLLHCGAVWRFY
jgi:hypothetical protein